MPAPKLRLFLRVMVEKHPLLGPGRADLLDAIDRTGSISAGAREMGMSYRRAWMHVSGLAEALGAPVVETAQGGRQGGGALLTQAGRTVLHAYRRIMRKAESAAARDLEELARSFPIRDPDEKPRRR